MYDINFSQEFTELCAQKKKKDVPSTFFLSSKTRFFLHSFHSAPMMPIRFFCEDKFFFVHRASGEVFVK